MSTKADLLVHWCARTGDPIPEARLRLRALSVGGLLPWRAEPLTYTDIAHALLGFVAATQHKDAAETVRRFSEFRCAAASGEQVPLMSLPLIDALTAALRPPLWVSELSVNVTNPRRPDRITGEHPKQACTLTVADGWRTELLEGTERTFPGPVTEYWFSEPAPPLPVSAATLSPVTISRTIHAALISRLLTDLMNHPPPPLRDGWIYPATKDDGPSTPGEPSLRKSPQ